MPSKTAQDVCYLFSKFPIVFVQSSILRFIIKIVFTAGREYDDADPFLHNARKFYLALYILLLYDLVSYI